MNARILCATIASCLVCLSLHASAAAAASPPRGSVAPVISLKDLGGEGMSTSKFAGKAFVVVFGEVGHEGTEQACADVLNAIDDPRLEGEAVIPFLVVARDAPPAQLKEEATRGHYPALILHDTKREAFGAYRVLVIPTLVVVDAKGKVVYSMPGYLQKSRDLLAEAILTGAGKQSVAQFDQLLEARTQGAPSPELARSTRLAHLGVELTRHGLFDMAEARFREAIAIVPGHVGATIGLGDLLLRRDQLPEAEACYRSLLTAHPESTEAQLGIAAVQIRRGGENLVTAEATLKPIIDKSPKQARARFLMGQIHEQRGDVTNAAAEYKAAAQILLER